MEKLMQDGIVGIVTGILTTVVLFVIKTIWDTKLRPLLEELRYGGVKIDGKWEGHGKGKSDTGEWSTDMLVFLTQSAHSLGGTYVLKHQSPSNSFEIHFKIRGYIWEGYAILNFTPLDRRVTSSATALLKIAGGGINLTGQISYRNVNTEQVCSEPMTLSRAA
jgi:hypothetical protein